MNKTDIIVDKHRDQQGTLMRPRLVITLDEDATREYLEHARKVAQGHVAVDCEPPGVTLTVMIGDAYAGTSVFIKDVELGEADVQLWSQAVDSINVPECGSPRAPPGRYVISPFNQTGSNSAAAAPRSAAAHSCRVTR